MLVAALTRAMLIALATALLRAIRGRPIAMRGRTRGARLICRVAV